MQTPLELEHQAVTSLEELGWEKPTPIQLKAFPVILRGRSTLLVAPTGSGKTEAAIIPILTRLLAKPPQSKGVRIMYITPLRALNRDILRRITKYSEMRGFSAEVRHGDTSTNEKQKMLTNPPEVLVTTPETLAILVTSPKMSQNLKTLEWVVIDELHELLGNERGAHLSLSLERLQNLATQEIVRVGLSASVGDLTEAARFLVGSRRKSAILTDPASRKYVINRKYVEGSINELAYSVIEHVKKVESLGGTVLLFTNTRVEAEYLGSIIKAKAPELGSEVHHGSLSREIREDAESRLRDRDARLVICTSSLELGLDIGGVDLVIQSGSARQAVKLVQRIGRSKHRVGEPAAGLVLTNNLDAELENIALSDRIQNATYEANEIHRGSLDVLAHQLAGMSLDRTRYTTTEALELIHQAYGFEDIALEDISACLSILAKQGILWYDGEQVKRKVPQTYQYYYDNVSTIPDIVQFEVKDTVSRRTIGRLDQMFVGEYGEPGKSFVLKGTHWAIISIDEEKRIVNVTPASRDVANIPDWIGELLPVDFNTAIEVGRLRRKILSRASISVSTAQVEGLRATSTILGCVPDNQKIVIERKEGTSSTLVIHACLGTKINQTLATLLSTILSSRVGFLVDARSDPYRILLTSTGSLTPLEIVETLRDEYDLETILSAAVVGTHPLNWKTWHVSKKFGVISKGAQYDRRAARLIQQRYRGTPLHQEVLRELFHEKYHISKTKEILMMIRSGEMEIRISNADSFSPLAKPILEYSSTFSALPTTIEKAVLDLVKERLNKRRHRLVCLSCGEWESVMKSSEVVEPVVCHHCRSRLVTDTYLGDNQLIQIVKKRIKGAKLNHEEETAYRRAWKTSSLIQHFGAKAIIVLSGFGVGSDTAARILRKGVEDENEVYQNIYRAEKTYVATKGFWRD